MAGWMQENADLMARLPFTPLVSSTAEVATAVAFELVLTVVASYYGARTVRAGRTHWFFMGLAGALFLNVFTHLAQWLYVGAYVPGIWAAPSILLPYMIWLAHRLRRAGLVDSRQALRSLGIAAPVGVVTVFTAQFLGQFLFRCEP